MNLMECTLPTLVDLLGDAQVELDELHAETRAIKNVINAMVPPGADIIIGLTYSARLPDLRCAPLDITRT